MPTREASLLFHDEKFKDIIQEKVFALGFPQGEIQRGISWWLTLKGVPSLAAGALWQEEPCFVSGGACRELLVGVGREPALQGQLQPKRISS